MQGSEPCVASLLKVDTRGDTYKGKLRKKGQG